VAGRNPETVGRPQSHHSTHSDGWRGPGGENLPDQPRLGRFRNSTEPKLPETAATRMISRGPDRTTWSETTGTQGTRHRPTKIPTALTTANEGVCR